LDKATEVTAAMVLLAVLFLALVSAVSGGQLQQTSGSLRVDRSDPADQSASFVRALDFKHRLRVCNAYPDATAVDIFRGKNERITSKESMAYKTCQDFFSQLRAGDKLEFKVGDATVGTFSVSDLPNNDAVLLLVIHRHDDHSTAVAFESHVFANLLNAQVAVIDTYKGSKQSSPRIMDVEGESKNARAEELRYNSVVAVNPGLYDVALLDPKGKTEAKVPLVALNRESYVVLRTGLEAKQGTSFPEELVVYPASSAEELHKRSGAARGAGGALAVALASAFLAAFSLC